MRFTVRQPVLVALCAAWMSAAGQADPADLNYGVLILHTQPTYELTNFCQLYVPHYGITTCEEQVTRLDVYDPALAVSYVVAAWNEDKEWCATEFGLGDFDPIFVWIVEGGACFPSQGTTVATSGWPGPHAGVVLTTDDAPWTGTFLPVYWLATYTYAYHGEHDLLPLAAHPVSSFAGSYNCLTPPEAFAAECLGGLGINEEGIYCCPSDPAGVTAGNRPGPGAQIELDVVSPHSLPGEVTIGYRLPEVSNVRLQVFDVGGRLVASLVNGLGEAGRNQVPWDGCDLYGQPVPAGVYRVRLAALGTVKAASLVVTR